MFSGKTSSLITDYKKWTVIGKKVLMINYVADERYGADDYVYSHDLVKIPCYKTKELLEIEKDKINNYDVIMINEGQFFSDLSEFCLLVCEKYGKNVIVCGLDGDYKRHPFSSITNLIPLCDTIIKLNAFCKVCNDGTEAIFTKRLSNEEDVIVIGSDNYIPLCRKHYCME